MSIRFWSRSFREFHDWVEPYETEGEKLKEAMKWFSISPIAASNAAFVGCCLTTVNGGEVDDEVFDHLIRKSLELAPLAGFTPMAAWNKVFEWYMEKDLHITMADFQHLQVIALRHRGEYDLDGAPYWSDVMNDWMPFSQFVQCVLNDMRAGHWVVDAAPRHFEQWFLDLGTCVVDQFLPLIDLRPYGSYRQTDIDAIVTNVGTNDAATIRFVTAALPLIDVEHVAVYGIDDADIRFCAHVASELITIDNFDFDATMQACGVNLAEIEAMYDPRYHEIVEEQGPDRVGRPEEFYHWRQRSTAMRTFEAYLGVYGKVRFVVENVEQFFTFIRREVDMAVAGLVAGPLVLLYDALGVVSREAAKVIIAFTGVCMEVMERVPNTDRTTIDLVGVIMHGVADLVDLRHRTNPKSVWAMLTTRRGARVSRTELFLMQMATFSYEPAPTYEAWAGDIIRQLGRTGMDTSVLSINAPNRAVFYPRATFGPSDNNDIEMAVDVNFKETAREAKRVVDALRRGAPRGIDNAWLADAATVQGSIDRYTVPRPTLSPLAKKTIIMAADALFEANRDLYDRPQPNSVAAAMLATEWKYSAGLPFIPAIRTRQQIKNSGWYQAIHQAVEHMSAEGVHRGIAFHTFPKADIVSRDKILADRTALRTVTAGDRLTAIQAQTVLGEVNKRVAPVEAYVANQLPRREGGFLPLYEALSQRPALVTTDGWRFDSQVPDEVVSLGSTRLYERGVEGWWGAKAATSFVQAYYAAVSTGLVVNLMDGSITRKTGGGGTGSAFTSSDNRNWARILFIAAFSLVFDLPPADFYKYFTFVNASDDILFGCEQMIFDRLEDLQACLLNVFGLRFDMESLGRTPDGWLNLRVVPEGMLDRHAYEELGIPVPEFPVMHDPARLALKRSDYRSDRMRLNYIMAADFIATQDFGHLLLTGHDIETYGDILEEAIEATSEFLGFFYKDVTWSKYLNGKGQLIGADYEYGGGPSNYLITDAARKVGPPGTPQHSAFVQRRLDEAKKWAKCHRYPSYASVLTAWIMPEDWSKMRPAQKKWTKLVSNIHVNVPLLDLIQGGLLHISAMTTSIPSGITRWSGRDVVPASKPVATAAFVVELFIYSKYIQNHKRRPSYGEFVSRCREAPYGSVCDPNGFWNWLSNQSATRIEDREKEYPPHVHQARMWVFTLAYGTIDYLQTVFRLNRILNFALGLFFFLVRDLDKAYSLIHLAYWLGKGEASPEISNLSPRDPYLAQKMLALLVVVLVPTVVFEHAQFVEHISDVVHNLSAAAYYGQKTRNMVAARINRVFRQDQDRFQEMRYWLATHHGAFCVKLSAAMGSGKSTSFVASILSLGKWTRVVLVVPFRALVDNYGNEFIPEDQVCRVTGLAGEDWATASVVVITAHRAMNPDYRSVFSNDSIVLIDEAHMASTQQIAVALTWNTRLPLVLMTGTPGGRLMDALDGPTIEVEYVSRFTRVVRVYPGIEREPPSAGRAFDRNVRHWAEDWVRDILTSFGDNEELRGGRFAVYFPLVGQCVNIAQMITRSGFQGTVVSAGSPAVPPSGAIVGTWVIATGMNFDPPLTAMIDCGCVARVRARLLDLDATAPGAHAGFINGTTTLELLPSDPPARDQVAARTGRVAAGVVYQAPFSGQSQWIHTRPDAAAILELQAQGYAHFDRLMGILHLTNELEMDPNPFIPIGAFRFLWVRSSQARADVRMHWVAMIWYVAIHLGSWSDAVTAAANVHTSEPEVVEILARAAEIVRSTRGGRISYTDVPSNYLALRSECFIREVPELGHRYWGARLPVVYDHVVGVSGKYFSTDGK